MLGEALPQHSARRRGTRRVATTLAVAAASVLVAACGSASTGSGSGATAKPQPDPATLNLGYLVNFTHAPALIGVSQGFFQNAMPSTTTVKTTTFSTGTLESEALTAERREIKRLREEGEIPDEIFRAIEYDLDLASARLS